MGLTGGHRGRPRYLRPFAAKGEPIPDCLLFAGLVKKRMATAETNSLLRYTPMNVRSLVICILSFALGAILFSARSPMTKSIASTSTRVETSANEDRSADREAIRAHIASIFQAFIDWDVDKIYATHSQDWRGFLEGTNVPIKGIDEYMRANGIDWPKDKGTKPSPNPLRGYKMKDFDVNFYGPDLAVACFMGEFERKNGDTVVTQNRLRIMDVYAKREGGWIQVASHTVVDPVWRSEQSSNPLNITPQIRQRILNAREAVWKAWFANDRATLERLIPAEAVAIEAGSDEWSDRNKILAGAKAFAENGGKLIKIEFPKTDIKVNGNTIILYTTFAYELEANGQRVSRSGRGTEIFVRRGDDLVNAGWHLDASK